VFIAGALDARTLQLAEACFYWTLEHPGSGGGAVLAGTPGTFYQDQAPAKRTFAQAGPGKIKGHDSWHIRRRRRRVGSYSSIMSAISSGSRFGQNASQKNTIFEYASEIGQTAL